MEKALEAAENIVEIDEIDENPMGSGVTDRRYFDDISTIQNNIDDNIVGSEARENGHSSDIDDIDDIFLYSKKSCKEKNYDDDEADKDLQRGAI